MWLVHLEIELFCIHGAKCPHTKNTKSRIQTKILAKCLNLADTQSSLN